MSALSMEKEQLLQTLAANEALVQQLQQSNAQLRKQLDQMGDTDDHFRFLDLPRELRDTIYVLCVASTGRIYLRPRPHHDRRLRNVRLDDFPQPEWQLLAVDRQVRGEAAQMLLTKNHIVVNHQLDDASMTRYLLSRPFPSSDHMLLRTMTKQHLTSISLTFDTRSLSQTNFMNSRAIALRTRSSDPEYCRKQYHELQNQETSHWLCSLDDAMDSPSLRSLQIDVSQCYCVISCCRLVRNVGVALWNCKLGDKLEKIEILGTKNYAERDIFISAVPALKKTSRPIDRKALYLHFKAFETTEGEDKMWEALDKCDRVVELEDQKYDCDRLW